MNRFEACNKRVVFGKIYNPGCVLKVLLAGLVLLSYQKCTNKFSQNNIMANRV